MTPKQQRFVSEYLSCLNATEAAKLAGYSSRTSYSIGQRLLKNVEVQAVIQQAMNERRNQLIADREQRQTFWTATMLDADIDMKHRLKASELLGKSEGDFTQQVQVQAEVSGSGYDLAKLSENELLSLRELLVKATGKDDKTE